MIRWCKRIFSSSIGRSGLYKILNITHNATAKEIRQAYHQMAKKYHPDINPDPASKQRFEEINLYFSL